MIWLAEKTRNEMIFFLDLWIFMTFQRALTLCKDDKWCDCKYTNRAKYAK